MELNCYFADSSDESGNQTVVDQTLLLHKCHLLFSQGQYREFVSASRRLLFHHIQGNHNQQSFKGMKILKVNLPWHLCNFQPEGEWNDMMVQWCVVQGKSMWDEKHDMFHQLYVAIPISEVHPLTIGYSYYDCCLLWHTDLQMIVVKWDHWNHLLQELTLSLPDVVV